MAKRSKSELDFIKSFVDGAYNRLGNILYVDLDRHFDPENPLGYCFKHIDPVNAHVIYQIVCAKTGISYTDFRVMMHEYGHIYLGHLDGIHEELDAQIVETFRDHRGELIDEINAACGIDFADKLIERVIDDPVLNHSLHNIAMDMEVNSKILSNEDVDEMEMDITSVLPKYREDALRYLRDQSQDEEEKKAIDDVLKKMESEAKIKLILPGRYKTGVDDQGNPIPFPDGLTYAEYLMLIIAHLDQFVKMLVSIQMGGNGDTSDITQEQIQQALQKQMQQFQNKSDAYKQGYNDAQNDFQNGTPGQQQRVVNGQAQQQPQGGQQGQQGQNGQNPSNQGQMPGGQMPSGGQSSGSGLQMPGQGQGQGQGQSGQGQGQGSAQGQGGPGQAQGQGGSGSGQGQSQGAGQGQGMSSQDLADYNQGYQDGMRDAANGNGGGSGMQGLNGLMSSMGMSSDGSSSGQGEGQGEGEGQGQGQGQGQGGQQGGSGGRYQGMRSDPTKGDARRDHRTPSRDEADQKRKLGKIRNAGGIGCGNDGGPDATREVDKEVDEVEMALNEVMQNVKARVIKRETRRDVMKLYNRGIIRSVIAPSISQKITVSVDPKVVYLIDISGSMDTLLVDRILKTIGKNMRKLNRGLKYDIITWSTRLGEHIKDIDPKKGVPRISTGGGTSLAHGIQYFKDHYGPEAILIVISDFEDYLEEWHKVEETMPEYTLYGFNYGDDRWNGGSDKIAWKNMKIKKFSNR